MTDQQWNDVKDVAEIAAASYWVKKVADADTDPVNSGGRIGGSTYVRNNAEYAGVAAGQIAVGHFVWAGVAKLFLVPFWAVTFCVMVLGSMLLTNGSGMGVTVLVVGAAFLLWLYVCCWRLSMKPILKATLKHGPNITPADGYRGPLGTSQTVYTGGPGNPVNRWVRTQPDEHPQSQPAAVSDQQLETSHGTRQGGEQSKPLTALIAEMEALLSEARQRDNGGPSQPSRFSEVEKATIYLAWNHRFAAGLTGLAASSWLMAFSRWSDGRDGWSGRWLCFSAAGAGASGMVFGQAGRAGVPVTGRLGV